MGKGPEFFSRPDSFPRRNKPQRGATGRRRESGKGKAQPSRRDREGRGRSGGCPGPGGAEPRGGGAAGPGGRGAGAAPPERLSPYPALMTPNPGGTFPAWLVFFPALFCFGSESV